MSAPIRAEHREAATAIRSDAVVMEGFDDAFLHKMDEPIAQALADAEAAGMEKAADVRKEVSIVRKEVSILAGNVLLASDMVLAAIAKIERRK